MDIDRFIAPPFQACSLSKDYDPNFTDSFRNKISAKKALKDGIKALAQYQDVLYANNNYALLLIFQAMDAAGKDSTIKHVMSGVNPQGCQVFSFKAPSEQELDHDYLWRSFVALPEKGRIGIFNRSYYEDVLVVRVHPALLERQQLPDHLKSPEIWKKRFEQINHFEKYLVENGIIVLKFFLNVSKEEQKERFLERIHRPEKNWKFSFGDVVERQFWGDYQKAYESVFQHTSSNWAPWHIIPADHKWFTRLVVAETIIQTLQSLNLEYPKVSDEHRQQLQEALSLLQNESP